MRSRLRGLGAIGLVALVAGGVAYGGTLTTHARATRAKLAGAGLDRLELTLDSGRLVVWQGGSGPDLVFLHGAGDQAGAWSKVAPAFTDRYRVHLLDLPGHGESDPATGPLRFSTVLAGLETFLATMEESPPAPLLQRGEPNRLKTSRSGGTPPILVGHSMGAWLAMVYAHRHGDRVARLVAVNGGPVTGKPSAINLMPQDREEARHTMAALRDPSSPELPDDVLDDIVSHAASGPVGRMMQAFGDMMSHLLDGRLAEIRAPVDLIWGASDQLLDLDYARRLERGLPAARLTVLERCGHLPPNECPERFLELLEQVLASDPPVSVPAPASQENPPPTPSSPEGEGQHPGDPDDPG